MTNKPLIIGVAGGTGAGKTKFVNAIVEAMEGEVVTLQHDNYYKDRSHLSPHEREQINYDHPEAFETDLLVQHLKEICEGKEISVPVYDFSTHSRQSQFIDLSAAKAIIIDGIVIFTAKKLREMMDIKIYVDTDADIRFIHRLQRDVKERGRSVESVITQYMETVRSMHFQFVEATRRYSDIIVRDANNPVAVDMVVAMLKKRLSDVAS